MPLHQLGAGRPSDLVTDSVGWDVATWSRALPYWLAHTRLAPGARALEVGAGGSNGGLSLWLADLGFHVTCSGLEPPSDSMRELHRRYGVADRVSYASDDVLTMSYVGQFDLVVFKSMLGRVGADDHFDEQQRAVARMHQALRPGGELWFAENAAGTFLHQRARRRFGAGRWRWRYVRVEELTTLMAPFTSCRWTTFGLTAAAGRTERQRRALASLDRVLLDRAAPPHWRYVVAGVARRAGPAVVTPQVLTPEP